MLAAILQSIGRVAVGLCAAQPSPVTVFYAIFSRVVVIVSYIIGLLVKHSQCHWQTVIFATNVHVMLDYCIYRISPTAHKNKIQINADRSVYLSIIFILLYLRMRTAFSPE